MPFIDPTQLVGATEGKCTWIGMFKYLKQDQHGFFCPSCAEPIRQVWLRKEFDRTIQGYAISNSGYADWVDWLITKSEAGKCWPDTETAHAVYKSEQINGTRNVQDGA